MSTYYNEHDPFAAAWLRALIADGLIPAGEVDERDIRDVRPADLAGFTACHFFSGIGGWAYALRLAGWPDDRPVWTGSCPCQPFSTAGRGDGFADERHLWPAWHWLVEQCRPPIVFGEQVASKAALEWWDLVSADLEAAGYAVGAADLCAAGVGAPHIRQRLYWVADADCGHRDRIADGERRQPNGAQAGRIESDGEPQCGSTTGRLADARRWPARDAGEFPCALGADEGAAPGEGWNGVNRPAPHCGATGRAGATDGFWRDADWLGCRDGRWRPVEPGTFPLAHGLPARVGRLRGYGNAIVPQVAAAFIAASMGAQA